MANLNDDKQKQLYDKMRPEQKQKEQQQPKKPKRGKGKTDSDFPDIDEARQNDDGGALKDQLFSNLQSSLSARLQTENPFDAFREAVERALIDKAKAKRKIFQPDRSFFKDAEDNCMCISMH